ncbi:MAG: hypothetical protein VB122_03155 [Erysipelotrichales bacterium]|jgi:cell division protein FtsL|nr:hypothetical protein [Bacilli bacterium]MEA4821224.1 hypothetical protein [Erysipelotrichales bacterium]
MQRSEERSRSTWNMNRATSIVLFGLAVIALMFVLKIGIDYYKQYKINERLNELRSDIIKENEYLENASELLQDSDYYSIYIREEFQFDGENIIRIP